MPSGRLASFWTYDKDTPALPITKAPTLRTASVGCQVSYDVAAALEREKERSDALAAENNRLRELVALLESKIRSLEHGGGTPQPAPPDAGVQGSGGGVAASVLSSAQVSPMHTSTSQGPVALDYEKRGGGGGGARTREPQQSQPDDWAKSRRDGNVPSSPPHPSLGDNALQQEAPSAPSGAASQVDDNTPGLSAFARPCPSLTSPSCESHDVEEILAQRAALTSPVGGASDTDILDFISSAALATAGEEAVTDVLGSGAPALREAQPACDEGRGDVPLAQSPDSLLQLRTMCATKDKTSPDDLTSTPALDGGTSSVDFAADGTCSSRSDSEQLLDAAADAAAAVAATSTSSSSFRSHTRSTGSGSSRESQKVRQEKKRKTTEDRKERREREREQYEREDTSRSVELTIRHRHVLECFICGQRPQDGDRRKVVFCANCPRKACLSCQEENGTRRDRTGWTGGQDTYGSYFVNPLCSRCLQSADDEIPTSEEALGFTLGVEITREEVSDGEMRSLLLRFLDWLENHDLSHFFVDEVDPEEYPEYREAVKHPMNFRRMRSRLMAGEYDDRRGGIMRLMEDVDWIRHNCTVFNGEEQAISRCAKILERRAKLYSEELITPLTTKLRRPGTELAPRAAGAETRRMTGAETRKRRCPVAELVELVELDRESDGECNFKSKVGGDGSVSKVTNGKCVAGTSDLSDADRNDRSRRRDNGDVESRGAAGFGVALSREPRLRRKSSRLGGVRDVDIAEIESENGAEKKGEVATASGKRRADSMARGSAEDESSSGSGDDDFLLKRPRRSACASLMSEESLSRSGFRLGGSPQGNACSNDHADIQPPDAVDQMMLIDDDDQGSSMSIDEEGISDQCDLRTDSCSGSKVDVRESDVRSGEDSEDSDEEVGKIRHMESDSAEFDEGSGERDSFSPSRREGRKSGRDASHPASKGSFSSSLAVSMEDHDL